MTGERCLPQGMRGLISLQPNFTKEPYFQIVLAAGPPPYRINIQLILTTIAACYKVDHHE